MMAATTTTNNDDQKKQTCITLSFRGSGCSCDK
jgi:hypothetical protein